MIYPAEVPEEKSVVAPPFDHVTTPVLPVKVQVSLVLPPCPTYAVTTGLNPSEK